MARRLGARPAASNSGLAVDAAKSDSVFSGNMATQVVKGILVFLVWT